MSVTVAGASTVARYVAWDPTAQQVREPDTTYLMDLDHEALLTPWEGGMIGANERSGNVADRPPWRGGSKVEVVPGRYRDGLRAASVSSGYLVHPTLGLLNPLQWTQEFQIISAVPWANLSQAIVYRFWCDFSQYVRVRINAGTVLADYRHNQDAVFVDKTITSNGHTVAADAPRSIAITLSGGTMRLYVEGVLAGSVADCTSPLAWNDSWVNGAGLAVSLDTTDVTVSDVRISRLARIPGQVPA